MAVPSNPAPTTLGVNIPPPVLPRQDPVVAFPAQKNSGKTAAPSKHGFVPSGYGWHQDSIRNKRDYQVRQHSTRQPPAPAYYSHRQSALERWDEGKPLRASSDFSLLRRNLLWISVWISTGIE